jgi:prepilin-type N-terminal cleavage/methylation domain-containing protein
MLKLFSQNNRSGFSLIEVVIALTVISIAFVAVATLVGRNLNANNTNRDYLTAHYLTQEAVEVVRNLRDSAWLNNYYLGGDGVATVFGDSLPPLKTTNYYALVDAQRDTTGTVINWELLNLGRQMPRFSDVVLGRYEIENGPRYYSAKIGDVTSVFARFVAITRTAPEDYSIPEGEVVFRVDATTWFGSPEDPNEIRYSTLLTDWKQGAL